MKEQKIEQNNKNLIKKNKEWNKRINNEIIKLKNIQILNYWIKAWIDQKSKCQILSS